MVSRKKYLLSGLGLLLLLGMLGISLSSFLVSRESIRSQLTDSTLPLIGDTIFSEIQRDLLRPIFVSSLMANNTFVHDWVEGGESDILGMQRYLDKIKQNYGAFTTFFVSDVTRNYYYPDGVLKRVEQANNRDAWYFRLRSGTDEFEINTDPDMANDDDLAVFVNFRVLDSEGEFIGAIGVGLAIRSLLSLVDQYSDKFDRKIYFADKQGEIQLNSSVHGDKSNILEVPGFESLAQNILSSTEEKRFSYTRNGSEVFLNSRYIDKLGWFLIVEERETRAMYPVTNTFIFNSLLSLFIALSVLVVAHRILNRYHKDLEYSAHHDNLTGVYNRQFFESVAKKSVEHTGRRGDSSCIMFIDIDHFKNVNDQYGHIAGDSVIEHIAQTVKSSIRKSDLICRWGGEEFCVILPDTLQHDAVELSEQVCQAVRDTHIQFEDTSIKVTVSIGVTQRIAVESFEDCLQRTDEALYTAKNNGRDQVCTTSQKDNLTVLDRSDAA